MEPEPLAGDQDMTIRSLAVGSRAWRPLAGLLIAVALAGCFGPVTGSPTGGPTPAPTPTASPTPIPGFRVTGSMTDARDDATATLLPDGRVLIAGPAFSSAFPRPTLAPADPYDTKTGIFDPTDPTAVVPGGHTATLLSDGRVLIAGGDGDLTQNSGGPLASAELWDPKTGKFAPTGSMITSRDGHTATLLSDGRVLIAGGIVRPPWEPIDVRTVLASAEVYQPPPRLTGRLGGASWTEPAPRA